MREDHRDAELDIRVSPHDVATTAAVHPNGLTLERAGQVVAAWAGSSAASVAAFALVVGWVLGGLVRPAGFDDTYQLYLNSPTTAVTFLMVFLIQRAQNVHQKAMHVKLNEIVCALHGARSELAGIEEQGEAVVDAAEDAFMRASQRADQ